MAKMKGKKQIEKFLKTLDKHQEDAAAGGNMQTFNSIRWVKEGLFWTDGAKSDDTVLVNLGLKPL
jgi:hypothetical protein